MSVFAGFISLQMLSTKFNVFLIFWLKCTQLHMNVVHVISSFWITKAWLFT